MEVIQTLSHLSKKSCLDWRLKRDERYHQKISNLREINTSLAIADQEILKIVQPEVRHRIEECLQFLSLSNRKVLAERIGGRALNNHNIAFAEEGFSYDSKQEQKFYLELQQYLGIIRTAILTDDCSQMQVPKVRQSFSISRIIHKLAEKLKRRDT